MTDENNKFDNDKEKSHNVSVSDLQENVLVEAVGYGGDLVKEGVSVTSRGGAESLTKGQNIATEVSGPESVQVR